MRRSVSPQPDFQSLGPSQPNGRVGKSSACVQALVPRRQEALKLMPNLSTFRDGEIVEMVHYAEPDDAPRCASGREEDAMKIEVLYFDGCPGHERLMPRLRELLAAEGVEDPVSVLRVQSLQDAEQQRFLGSPTLRIDGVDVDPTAVGRTDFGLKCRLYRNEGRQETLPPEEWIVDAIERARAPAGAE
jgi:hypothetical protein